MMWYCFREKKNSWKQRRKQINWEGVKVPVNRLFRRCSTIWFAGEIESPCSLIGAKLLCWCCWCGLKSTTYVDPASCPKREISCNWSQFIPACPWACFFSLADAGSCSFFFPEILSFIELHCVSNVFERLFNKSVHSAAVAVSSKFVTVSQTSDCSWDKVVNNVNGKN